MLGTGWLTHSLGIAVAAALLAADPSTALAQSAAAPTREPSRPAESSASDQDGSRDGRREPPPAWLTDLSLFDNRLTSGTKPKSPMDSWLAGVEMTCFGCGGFEATAARPGSTNATAPWVLQGRWRRQTALGAVSTGFVGVRNYALPLSTAMALGGAVDPAALGHLPATSFAPVSQWSLTAAVEKTLVRRANGASIGVAADLLIPVATNSVTVGDPRINALTTPTIRVGIVFRW
jgi:hypothetical protein